MAALLEIVCGALAIVSVALAAALARRAARTRTWRPVEAHIQGNGVTIQLLQGEAETGDIDAYDRRYRPNVSYSDVVDGLTHIGNAIAPDLAEAFGSDAWALRVLGRYPVGSRATANHDPADPARTVLEPGASRNTVLTAIVPGSRRRWRGRARPAAR